MSGRMMTRFAQEFATSLAQLPSMILPIIILPLGLLSAHESHEWARIPKDPWPNDKRRSGLRAFSRRHVLPELRSEPTPFHHSVLFATPRFSSGSEKSAPCPVHSPHPPRRSQEKHYSHWEKSAAWCLKDVPIQATSPRDPRVQVARSSPGSSHGPERAGGW